MKSNINNANSLDNFFSYVSKAVIIVPIFIFVFSLILKFNQSKPNQVSSEISQTINISPTQSITNKIPIDLIGPWICTYQEGYKLYSLYIKNKKVTLEIKENNQTKKQDFSSYVPYVESFLNKDISVLEDMVKQYSGKKINLNEVLSSCKKTL